MWSAGGKMTRFISLRCAAALGAAAWLAFLSGASPLSALQQKPPAATWITAWGSSHQVLGTAVLSNATVRMIARSTIGGEAVRVRLDNAFGSTPLVVGSAYVGPATQGAAVAAGSNRQLRFGGSTSVSIAPGGTVISDAVQMRVLPRQDLAVSMYLPEQNVRPSQHTAAYVTSYLTPNDSGDAASDEAAGRFSVKTTSTFWLKAIDVQTASANG